MNDLLAVREALDAGHLEEARELLRELLKNPDAETYFVAAQAAVTAQQKQDFLKKAVELDPFHVKAHELLDSLAPAASTPTTPETKSLDAAKPVASTPPPPPVPVSTGSAQRGIPRTGLTVLGVVIVVAIVVGGLLIASGNSASYNATLNVTQSAIARANDVAASTRNAGNSRSTATASIKTAQAKNAPALTATAAAQVKVGQDFLRNYFLRNYSSAGALACRSIANNVNSGKYSSMARAIDKMFGTEPKVSSSTCKLVNGVLQCSVRGSFNYNNFAYELDLRTSVENNKICVSSISEPR